MTHWLARVRRWRGWRYVLLQVPGWAVALVLVIALHQWGALSARTGILLLLLWTIKDAALYPWLRAAYDVDTRLPIERLVGARGVAMSVLAPGGYIRCRGELWRAEIVDTASGTAHLKEGTAVEIVAARGITLVVRELPGPPARSSEDPGSPRVADPQ